MELQSTAFEHQLQAFIYNILLAARKQEIDMHKQRVKEHMDKHLAAGRRMFGTPPLWYEMRHGLMKAFMPNARIVQEIYKKIYFDELPASTKHIIRLMKKRGFRDRNMRLRTPTPHIVRNLLTERSIMEAAGYVNYQGKWIQGQHEALIPDVIAYELVEKLNQLKVARK